MMTLNKRTALKYIFVIDNYIYIPVIIIVILSFFVGAGALVLAIGLHYFIFNNGIAKWERRIVKILNIVLFSIFIPLTLVHFDSLMVLGSLLFILNYCSLTAYCSIKYNLSSNLKVKDSYFNRIGYYTLLFSPYLLFKGKKEIVWLIEAY